LSFFWFRGGREKNLKVGNSALLLDETNEQIYESKPKKCRDAPLLPIAVLPMFQQQLKEELPSSCFASSSSSSSCSFFS
jgi:hypothetical protein